MDALPASQQGRVVGVAALKLIQSGTVKWKDVVSPTGIKSLAQVAAAKKLTVPQMVKAGVSPGVAAKALAAAPAPPKPPPVPKPPKKQGGPAPAPAAVKPAPPLPAPPVPPLFAPVPPAFQFSKASLDAGFPIHSDVKAYAKAYGIKLTAQTTPAVKAKLEALFAQAHGGPAPVPPPKPQPAPAGGFPADPHALPVVKQLGGSTGAELVRDPVSGKLYVKKQGGNAGHLLEEGHADAAYAALGVPVPASKIYVIDGKPVKLAEYIEGKTLGDLYKSDPKAAAAAEAELRKHFLADALLGNWDAIGMGADNILVGKDGTVYHIDNGGSLRYRAQGALKDPGKFGSIVAELQSLRDPKVNPQTAKVFGSLTDAELKQQALKLLSKKDALLAAVPAEVRATLEKRLAYLQGWAEPKPVPTVAGWQPLPADAVRRFAEPAAMEEWGKKAYNEWARGLSHAEASALGRYTGSGYVDMNATLRDGKKPGESSRLLDAALRRASLPEPIEVRRGISNLPKMGYDINQIRFGDEITDKGFMSTTLKPEADFGGGAKGAWFTVRLPAGAPGAYVNASPQSSHEHEREFLLPPGSKFRVVEVKPAAPGKTPEIVMEWIPG